MMTTEEAVKAVLALNRSPVMGRYDLTRSDTGALLRELNEWSGWSSGEKALIEFATMLWTGRLPLFGVVDDQIASEVLEIMRDYFIHEVIA